MCACFGWCYVDKLTTNKGMLDFIPKYYPRNSLIERVLRCPHCLSGWLSVFLVGYVFFSQLSYLSFTPYLYTIFAPFFTMAIVNIIKS